MALNDGSSRNVHRDTMFCLRCYCIITWYSDCHRKRKASGPLCALVERAGDKFGSFVLFFGECYDGGA